MKLSELCFYILVAVLLGGVSDDLMMSRVGAVLAVCLLREAGKYTDDITTLYMVYNMHISGLFNDLSPGGLWAAMQTNDLALGGVCAIYLALNSRWDLLPNPDLPF
jgi:hypothetical protein